MTWKRERTIGRTGRFAALTIAAWLLAAGCDEDGSDNGPGPEPQGTLVLNELLARNNSVIMDEWGQFDDWLELWNPGQGTVATGDFALTDNFDLPARWRLPDTLLAAGEHLLIWTDNETGQGRWHASFRLSVDGEEVALHRLTGSGAVLVDSVSYGPQQADTSYARQPDGGAWSLDPTPTPRAPNS